MFYPNLKAKIKVFLKKKIPGFQKLGDKISKSFLAIEAIIIP